MPGGRPKGYPKTGGRKKGVKNWSTLALRERLEELGHDPLEGLTAIAKDMKNDVAIRMQANAHLAKYLYPQLKAMEVSGPGGASAIPVEVLARIIELRQAKP